MENKEALMRNMDRLKPQFKIADKFLDMDTLGSNVIIEHLELQLAKRDALANAPLPKQRLKLLK